MDGSAEPETATQGVRRWPISRDFNILGASLVRWVAPARGSSGEHYVSQSVLELVWGRAGKVSNSRAGHGAVVSEAGRGPSAWA